jgi:hypothetical protein
LIDFGLLVPEEKILENFQSLCIFTLSQLPPLGKGLSPFFEDI